MKNKNGQSSETKCFQIHFQKGERNAKKKNGCAIGVCLDD